jgi:hypothetical protein
MIILNLQCEHGHRFEGWFASRESFDEQAQRGFVHCAVCQSVTVAALPSGPHVRRSQVAATAESPPDPAVEETTRRMFQALAAMARNAENVGVRFPEEARRIHYEEIPARNIRGQATHEETRELLEEGILVLPAPVPPESDTH